MVRAPAGRRSGRRVRSQARPVLAAVALVAVQLSLLIGRPPVSSSASVLAARPDESPRPTRAPAVAPPAPLAPPASPAPVPTAAATASPAPSPAAASVPPMRLYVFAGQSNMIDALTSMKALDALDPSLRTQPDVRFWGPNEDVADKSWAPLAAPTEIAQAYSHAGFGPEIGAAPPLARRHPGATAIVKLSRSATSLARDWSPKTAGGLYAKLLAEVRTARRALVTATGRPVVLAGMFWMQGESDARYAATAKAYAANLTSFIAAIRSDLGSPSLPFVIGEIPELAPNYPDFAFCPDVQAAQRSVAAKDPRAFYVPTADLEFAKSSPAHFSTRGVVELGRRFADARFPL